MPENTDYKRFRDNVPLPGDRIDRVENILVAGMPDINLCIGGKEFWIEQKSPTEPVRPSTPLFGSNPRLSQDQMNWFLRQRKAGGRCFVLITTDKRWLLMSGELADDINKMTVAELIDSAIWMTTKPVKDKEQWTSLRAALIRR